MSIVTGVNSNFFREQFISVHISYVIRLCTTTQYKLTMFHSHVLELTWPPDGADYVSIVQVTHILETMVATRLLWYLQK